MTRDDMRAWVAAAVCAAGSVWCFAALARAGDAKAEAAKAAWAWAQCGAHCGGADCRPNAAWVWASVAVPPAKPPLKTAAELGLEWRPAKDYVQLVRPGRCIGGRCTPDELIGGWRDGEYRPYAAGRWGKPTEPPCRTPVEDAATILASIMAGLIVEGFTDGAPQKEEAEATTVVALSASRPVLVRPIAAPIRRVLALPIRALRSLWRNRPAAMVAATAPTASVAVTTTIVTQPAVEYLVFPEAAFGNTRSRVMLVR